MGFGFRKLAGLGKALGVLGAGLSFVPGMNWVGLGMMVAGAGITILSATDQRQKKTPVDLGHRMNVRSSRAPLKVICGTIEVGVNKTYYYQQNPYLHIIAEISEGVLDGIKRQDGTTYMTTGSELPATNPPLVYFDGKLWTEYGTGNVYMEFYSGTSYQGVCSALYTASGGEWNYTLPYTAYLYVRLKYDPTKFAREPEITVVVTRAPSNPALVAYNILTASSQRGGLGVSASAIDIFSLAAAQDYCNAKGWTCNIAFTDQVPVTDMLEQVLACYRGAIIFSDGKYKFRFADLNHESVVAALDEGDVIDGSLSITSVRAAERPNAIRVTYLDASNHYLPSDYQYAASDAVAADGDLREKQVTLYGLTSQDLVQKMAYYLLERDRLMHTVTFRTGDAGFALEPYDLITLTHSMPGWVDQKLRVLSARITSDQEVTLTCVDEHSVFYDDAYSLYDQSYRTTTLLDPSDVPSVTNVSIEEETYTYRLRTYVRLNITFDPPTDYPYFDHVQVWVSTDGGTTWEHRFNSENDFSIDPAEEGATYYIKLVSVNIFGNKQSFENVSAFTHVAIGKSSTAPASLTGLTAVFNGATLNVFANPVSDSDVEVYEFRLGAAWTGSVYLAAMRAPNLSIGGVRPGTHTIWCNTRGANGVYGETPRSVTVTIGLTKGYSISSTLASSQNIIANSAMESTAYWLVNSPGTMALSTARYYGGAASIRVQGGSSAGIYQSGLQIGNGQYTFSAWAYPEGTTSLKIVVQRGSGSGATTYIYSVNANQWNFLSGAYSETTGGTSGRITLANNGGNATVYWDNAIMFAGQGSSAAAYYYADRYISAASTDGTYDGIWYGPTGDSGSIAQRLVYLDTSFVVIGGDAAWIGKFNTTSVKWSDVMTTASKWAEIFAPSAAPEIRCKIQYGESTLLNSTVDGAEINAAIVTARYFRPVVYIKNNSPDERGLALAPSIVLAT